MSEIIVIAAVAQNNVIGNGLKIPWHISEDFKRFKQLTLHHVVMMGDRTYDSLPTKPLPDRENIILTFNKDYQAPGAVIKYSFEEALDHCKDREKIFIIGGASVYKIGLEKADTLELTRIHKDFKGDVFFPEIDFDQWQLINQIDMTDDKVGAYSFLTYKRKR